MRFESKTLENGWTCTCDVQHKCLVYYLLLKGRELQDAPEPVLYRGQIKIDARVKSSQETFKEGEPLQNWSCRPNDEMLKKKMTIYDRYHPIRDDTTKRVVVLYRYTAVTHRIKLCAQPSRRRALFYYLYCVYARRNFIYCVYNVLQSTAARTRNRIFINYT